MAPLQGNQFLQLDPDQKRRASSRVTDPLSHLALLDASSPERGELAKPSGFAREGSANRSYPFGPLCENEFVAARSPRQTQKYKIHSADNGRAKRSHFSIVSSFYKLKFPKYAIYACKVLFLRGKYCILVSFTAGFTCQNASRRESIAFRSNQERGIL